MHFYGCLKGKGKDKGKGKGHGHGHGEGHGHGPGGEKHGHGPGGEGHGHGKGGKGGKWETTEATLHKMMKSNYFVKKINVWLYCIPQ